MTDKKRDAYKFISLVHVERKLEGLMRHNEAEINQIKEMLAAISKNNGAAGDWWPDFLKKADDIKLPLRRNGVTVPNEFMVVGKVGLKAALADDPGLLLIELHKMARDTYNLKMSKFELKTYIEGRLNE